MFAEFTERAWMPARPAASIWFRISASSGETMTAGAAPAGDQRPDRCPLVIPEARIRPGQRPQAALGLLAQARIVVVLISCHAVLRTSRCRRPARPGASGRQRDRTVRRGLPIRDHGRSGRPRSPDLPAIRKPLDGRGPRNAFGRRESVYARKDVAGASGLFLADLYRRPAASVIA